MADVHTKEALELFFDIDELVEPSKNNGKDPEITLELIKKMIDWDRNNKHLTPQHFKMMFDIVNGKEKLTSENKKYCLMNFRVILKYGFKM